jgi:hypothetical protein
MSKKQKPNAAAISDALAESLRATPFFEACYRGRLVWDLSDPISWLAIPAGEPRAFLGHIVKQIGSYTWGVTRDQRKRVWIVFPMELPGGSIIKAAPLENP